MIVRHEVLKVPLSNLRAKEIAGWKRFVSSVCKSLSFKYKNLRKHQSLEQEKL